VRRISIDGNGQLALRVSSLFVYKVITFHEGKEKTNSNLDNQGSVTGRMGRNRGWWKLKDSKFGREGEME